jgi:alkaline phosphatase D
VDLVVHVGDYIYEDGKAGERPHEPPEELLALDQYRARYAQHRLDPDLQALHARHPMVAVWDDHEIAGNAWSGGAPGHDEVTDGPWIDRLRAAGQAYSEWLPGRTSRSAVDGRLQAWRTLSLGGLAELVVLDTRSWGRDRQPASAAELGGPPEGGAPGSSRTILGEDQMRFVTERLAGSDGTPRPPWVLLANQVMFHPLEVPVPVESLAQAVEDEGFLVVDGKAVNPDQWDGYPQDRDRLVEAMGDQGGVVVLTGDVHSSWAWEGPATVAGGGPAMVELVTPSVSTEALADRLPVPAGAVEAALSGLSDDLSHVELSSHGYLLVDLEADRVQGEWWYVDPDDPSSVRFGAARSTSRAAPMRLTEVDEPLPEPQARSAPTSTTRGTAGAPSSEPDDDDDRTALVAGAGAVAVTALAGAAVALRRRRPHPSP